MPGAALDAELRDALTRYGLEHKVHLHVADSRTVDPPPEPLELLFVDGTTATREQGGLPAMGRVRRPGGHLLFHDAVDSGGYGNHYPGVARAVGEVDAGAWERRPDAGSIAHFVRR